MSSTKIKGICKGSFKYISQIFVVKEREMDIGRPTDVKHVAHIGWDGPDSTAPTWMNEFKGGSDMALASAGSTGGSRDATWSSQDFEHSLGRQPSSARLSNFPPGNTPSIPRKPKRKKIKSTSSTPKSSSGRSSRASSKHNSMLDGSEESSRHSVRL
ncbi:CRIB domain-containing protein RIC10-like [Silene latifolia]|uniref:CRIB domain-containing protein RIC10-like n=1 Tax=Silene latifolia TaxID=37657 RepID=UPI003D784CF5